MYTPRVLFSRLFLHDALQRYGHLEFSHWLPAVILDLAQPEIKMELATKTTLLSNHVTVFGG